MTFNWTPVGREHTANKEVELLELFDSLHWEELPLKAGASPGYAINELIEEFKIPAKKIALSNVLAPFGLIGIEGKYKNGTARVFFLDAGAVVTPLGSCLCEEAV